MLRTSKLSVNRIFLAFVFVSLVGFAHTAHAQAPKGTIPPHSVTLTWTNPTDPSGTTITGSNTYKCSGSCTATGTFSVVNTAPISGTTYTDFVVTANSTYSYCVTNLVTLSSGPFETSCSNIVSATIPKDAASSPTLNPPVTQ